VVSGQSSRLVVSASHGFGPLQGLAGAGDSPVPGQTCSRQTVLPRTHASSVSAGISWTAARPSLCTGQGDPPSGSTRIPPFAGCNPFAWACSICWPPRDSPLCRAAHTTSGSPGVYGASQTTRISSGQTYAPSSTSTNASDGWTRRTSSHGAPDHADICGSWPWRKMMLGHELKRLNQDMQAVILADKQAYRGFHAHQRTASRS
jgi:hypothetical protein